MGIALLFTSIVLTTGFVVLGVFGTMLNTVHFGFLAATGIVIAFLADIIVAPALIALVKRPTTEMRFTTSGLSVSGARLPALRSLASRTPYGRSRCAALRALRGLARPNREM